jgi:hypothetical protein
MIFLTRTQRYTEVNDILKVSRFRSAYSAAYGVVIVNNGFMGARELDEFERFCPEFDWLRDDGERQEAIRCWRDREEGKEPILSIRTWRDK